MYSSSRNRTKIPETKSHIDKIECVDGGGMAGQQGNTEIPYERVLGKCLLILGGKK